MRRMLIRTQSEGFRSAISAAASITARSSPLSLTPICPSLNNGSLRFMRRKIQSVFSKVKHDSKNFV